MPRSAAGIGHLYGAVAQCSRAATFFASGIRHPHTRSLPATRAQRAVVLVVQNNAQSSAGLLLNRASPLSVADLNTCDASKACFAGAAVRAGGSQSPASLLVLHGHAEVTDSRCVAPGLYTGGLRTACALVHAGAVRAESFALLAGYMAWPPGELRRQTEAGLWLPVSVSPELVLQVACDTTFQHLAWYRLFSSVSIADRS